VSTACIPETPRPESDAISVPLDLVRPPGSMSVRSSSSKVGVSAASAPPLNLVQIRPTVSGGPWHFSPDVDGRSRQAASQFGQLFQSISPFRCIHAEALRMPIKFGRRDQRHHKNLVTALRALTHGHGRRSGRPLRKELHPS
jgi:hypothetical protein